MKHVTEDTILFIKSFEGFRADTYLDIANIPTIGFGHVLKPGESYPGGISSEQGVELLRCDLKNAEQSVSRLIHVPLNDNQYGSLVSFTFNLGGGVLQRSTLRQKVNREEHDQVPQEFIKWIWAGGRKSNGLLRRRIAEARFYEVT